MKKLFILSMILLSLTLVGCSQKTQVEQSTGELSKSELFEKKQECAKYKENIELELNEDRKEDNEFGINSYYGLSEIFYSPTENTCIALIEKKRKLSYDSERLNFLSIYDLLKIDYTDYNIRDSYDMNEYNAILKELRGE